MTTIHLFTNIKAPIETVFNNSRNITVHIETASKTNEKAIAGICAFTPSIHAPTVPEYAVSDDRLNPLLIPDIITSGRIFKPCNAITTASAGVPATAYTFSSC